MQYILTEQEYKDIAGSETNFTDLDIMDIKPVLGYNQEKLARINIYKGGKKISLTVSKEVIAILNKIVNS